MMGFNNIIGHEEIIGHLKNAIESGKISHSYIFTGEPGSGKKLLAGTFAATLQCEAGGTEPCQKCDSCKDRRDCGLTPACVSACPTSSIKFGPLEEAMADMDFLPDSAKTRPCLYINRPKVNPASLRTAAGAKGGNQTHE